MMHDLWRSQAFLGLIAIAAYIPHHLRSRYGPEAWVLWGYVLISSLFGFMNPIALYGKLQTQIDQTTGQAFAIAIILPLFVLRIQNSTVSSLLRWIEIFTVINSILIIFFGYGAFNASSMDASFTAAVLPMIFFRPEFYRMLSDNRGRPLPSFFQGAFAILMVGIPVVAIIVAKSATAIVILCSSITAYAFATKRYYAVIFAFIAAAVGLITQGPELWNSAGRFEQWAVALEWWTKNANPIFGTGFGTFEWIGPSLRLADNAAFLFMHCEPLQILFEGGILGVFLASALVIRICHRARHRPWLVSTIAGIAVFSATQFPLRFFISAIFLLLIARLALERIGDKETWPQS